MYLFGNFFIFFHEESIYCIYNSHNIALKSSSYNAINYKQIKNIVILYIIASTPFTINLSSDDRFSCWFWRQIKFKENQYRLLSDRSPESGLKLCQTTRKTNSTIIRKTEHVENYDPPCRWHAITPAVYCRVGIFFQRHSSLRGKISPSVAALHISRDSASTC